LPVEIGVTQRIPDHGKGPCIPQYWYRGTTRPADVAASGLLATVEGSALNANEGQAIRLGLAVVAGLGEVGGRSVVEARRFGPFRSLADFSRRARLGRRAVEALIWAGAFDGWDAPRRQLLWDPKAALDAAQEPPALPPGERQRLLTKDESFSKPPPPRVGADPVTHPDLPHATRVRNDWLALPAIAVTSYFRWSPFY
jgi:DNA polymerase III alpha subunit